MDWLDWRPLEGRYWPMLISALGGLVPFILATTAAEMFRKQVLHDLGMQPVVLGVVSGLATAGYCFGALLGGDLINRISQRRLFLTAEAAFTGACIMTALAGGLWPFAVGRIIFGFATGIMLVTALPPVVQSFSAQRMPFTAVFINIGFFGAVTAGPLVGGAVALFGHWRAFYGGFAFIGLANIGLAFISVPKKSPINPDLPFDLTGILLGFAATALPFWGSGELTGHNFHSPWFYGPMSAGLAAFFALLIVEYLKKDALSPIRQMWTTIPVVSTAAAMIGGGVLVTFLDLAMQAQLRVGHNPPMVAGLTFWPQIVGTVIAAVVMGRAMRTRYLPLCILVGMLMLILMGGLILSTNPGAPNAMMLAVSFLLGLGAGLTVGPALFLAGFPLPAMALGRIYALVELVRSVTDFVIAPVLVRVAQNASHGQHLTAPGVEEAIRISILLAVVATAFLFALWMAGETGLPMPDLKAWLEEGGVALKSPEVAKALRNP